MSDVEWLYGYRYNRVTSLVVDPLTRDQARERHRSGETYSVLLRAGAQNEGAVEMNTRSRIANVYFFDEANRIYLDFGFEPAAARDSFFLSAVSMREWGVDHLQPDRHELLYLEEDGTAHRRITDRIAGTFTEEDGEKPIELLGINYEPMPGFGDYASLFRIEREKSVADQEPDSLTALLRDAAVRSE